MHKDKTTKGWGPPIEAERPVIPAGESSARPRAYDQGCDVPGRACPFYTQDGKNIYIDSENWPEGLVPPTGAMGGDAFGNIYAWDGDKWIRISDTDTIKLVVSSVPVSVIENAGDIGGILGVPPPPHTNVPEVRDADAVDGDSAADIVSVIWLRNLIAAVWKYIDLDGTDADSRLAITINSIHETLEGISAKVESILDDLDSPDISKGLKVRMANVEGITSDYESWKPGVNTALDDLGQEDARLQGEIDGLEATVDAIPVEELESKVSSVNGVYPEGVDPQTLQYPVDVNIVAADIMYDDGMDVVMAIDSKVDKAEGKQLSTLSYEQADKYIVDAAVIRNPDVINPDYWENMNEDSSTRMAIGFRSDEPTDPYIWNGHGWVRAQGMHWLGVYDGIGTLMSLDDLIVSSEKTQALMTYMAIVTDGYVKLGRTSVVSPDDFHDVFAELDAPMDGTSYIVWSCDVSYSSYSDLYKYEKDPLPPEYDSGFTYDTGDLAMNSGLRYECQEDGVTGAWDPSKWADIGLPDWAWTKIASFDQLGSLGEFFVDGAMCAMPDTQFGDYVLWYFNGSRWVEATADLYSRIMAINAAIAGLSGQGQGLNTHDFGTASPDQEALTEYAAVDIWGAGGTFTWDANDPGASTYVLGDGTTHTAAEIFNGTWVINENDDSRWQLANTPSTNPKIYAWLQVANHVSVIDIATDDKAGIVRGSDAAGYVQYDASGYGQVQGLATVALSGSYASLTGTPALGTMAGETASDYRKSASQDVLDAAKLDKNQGQANQGKYMKVGSDGVLVPDDVPTPEGGNFNTQIINQIYTNFSINQIAISVARECSIIEYFLEKPAGVDHPSYAFEYELNADQTYTGVIGLRLLRFYDVDGVSPTVTVKTYNNVQRDLSFSFFPDGTNVIGVLVAIRYDLAYDMQYVSSAILLDDNQMWEQIEGLATSIGALSDSMANKLDKDQGSANQGKFLSVGNTGDVTLVDAPSGGGGGFIDQGQYDTPITVYPTVAPSKTRLSVDILKENSLTVLHLVTVGDPTSTEKFYFQVDHRPINPDGVQPVKGLRQLRFVTNSLYEISMAVDYAVEASIPIYETVKFTIGPSKNHQSVLLSIDGVIIGASLLSNDNFTRQTTGFSALEPYNGNVQLDSGFLVEDSIIPITITDLTASREYFIKSVVTSIIPGRQDIGLRVLKIFNASLVGIVVHTLKNSDGFDETVSCSVPVEYGRYAYVLINVGYSEYINQFNITGAMPLDHSLVTDNFVKSFWPDDAQKLLGIGLDGKVTAVDSPVASLADVAYSGAYSDLSGRPSLSSVATSGAYSDLSGRPSLAAVATSGAYSDLSGRPTIPADSSKVTSTVNVTLSSASVTVALPSTMTATNADIIICPGDSITTTQLNALKAANVTQITRSSNNLVYTVSGVTYSSSIPLKYIMVR